MCLTELPLRFAAPAGITPTGYLVAGLVAADGVLYGAIDDCGRTALSFVYDYILMPTERTPDDLLVAAIVWETETTGGLIFT